MSPDPSLNQQPGVPPPTTTTPAGQQHTQQKQNTIIDDKSPHCIPFIISHLHHHLADPIKANRPFVVGLNGIQGAGKTTLVSALAENLRVKEGLETLVLSIDDLYLTREDQVKLASEHAANKLVQYRGEPGTHDMQLAHATITSLLSNRETKIPSYDKSLHSGLGDRLPLSQWKTVNGPSQPPIRVIVLEGWCVGFRSLPPSTIAAKQASPTSLTLQNHKLEDLLFVNEKLREYDVLTDAFDAFIHIDAEDTRWVYDWREEQESALRRERGVGMSVEEVKNFVDAYFPAYELFVEGVRDGVLKGMGQDGKARQLRLVVGKDRRVKQVLEI
ncbi:p-loop containing nucleoside triphosphate hydrolase [Venustampulla echinocandica]|uniref:p-loop containing nucleoside triphosphate hydrolase n=1 Tax=Venustampulla echinocandica TaxID=2656787 RepID=A0A370TTK5_9HELO|nr:p-loop containing nucleoside triphosphate hydrolase [Venustampulla echinocandica]RDL38828.1 p-loop containing nucleoside triphosphate hydrolase [Venustampulla echinocandica]